MTTTCSPGPNPGPLPHSATDPMIVPVGGCPAGCRGCTAAHLFLDRLAQGHHRMQPGLGPDFALSGQISLPPCAALQDLGMAVCALTWAADARGVRLSHPGGTILRSTSVAGGSC